MFSSFFCIYISLLSNLCNLYDNKMLVLEILLVFVWSKFIHTQMEYGKLLKSHNEHLLRQKKTTTSGYIYSQSSVGFPLCSFVTWLLICWYSAKTAEERVNTSFCSSSRWKVSLKLCNHFVKIQHHKSWKPTLAFFTKFSTTDKWCLFWNLSCENIFDVALLTELI